MDGQFFSIQSLHTISGGALAVMVVLQLIKEGPFLRLLPTKLVAVAVGEIIAFCTSELPHSLSQWAVLLLNGILISSTAIGGWHLANRIVSQNKK